MNLLRKMASATCVIVAAMALASVGWIEYSARSSCASVGSSPAPARTASDAPATLVDEILPEYQIDERHSVFVEAPPARVFDSFKRAKADDRPLVRLFNLLPVLSGKRDASSRPEDKPLYKALRDSSGLVLDERNRELVTANIATVDEHTPSTPDTPGGFVAYQLERGEMKLSVSFRVHPEEVGSQLTTETRIMFDDPDLCRGFAWYWGVIYPGSSLLRLDFLDAVERRAEHGTASSAEDWTDNAKIAIDGGTA